MDLVMAKVQLVETWEAAQQDPILVLRMEASKRMGKARSLPMLCLEAPLVDNKNPVTSIRIRKRI